MSRLPVQKVKSAEDRSLPIFDEIEEVARRVRDRAFDIFAGRGFAGGHDLDDWLQAEREIGWPEAELAEEDKEFVIKIALAGFDPDDIEVTATPREIIVKAKHEFERKEERSEGDETHIRWTEFRSNDVCRRIDLPADVDVDKIGAEFKRGMLTVKAPKAAVDKQGKARIKISTVA